MSIDIDRALSGCPDYVEWSNSRLDESQNHYENDPDYQRWVESLSEDVDGEPEGFEPLTDEDWEIVLDVSFRNLPIRSVAATAEEQAFFDTYCL